MKGCPLEYGRRQVRPRSRFHASSARGRASCYADHGQRSGGRGPRCEAGRVPWYSPNFVTRAGSLTSPNDEKPRVGVSVRGHRESNRDRAELVALRRLGTVEDCAKVVEFLATDLSDYVTGAVIPIDGGLVRG